MNEYELLMGMGVDDDAKMQALANQLRTRGQGGQMLSLSTIPQAQQMGTRMQRSAQQSARDVGTRRTGALNRARQARLDEQNLAFRQAQEERARQQAARQQQQFEQNTVFRQAQEERAKAEEARKQKEFELELKKTAEGGELTPTQIQTGLDKVEKKIKPLQDVIQSVQQMDSVLAPYAKGGAAEDSNIPGLGYGEGSRRAYGDVIRAVQGQEAQDVFRSTQSILTKLIKESAGLAQTLTETANVLKSLGAQEISSEESYLKALNELKSALRADQKRIAATTHPDVLKQMDKQYGGHNPLTTEMMDLDFSNRYSARPGDKKEQTTPQARATELDDINKRIQELEAMEAQQGGGSTGTYETGGGW